MIETLTTYPLFVKKIEYFQLTNLTITLLSCPLLFLESGRDRSSGSISTPESLQLLITVFSRSSEMLLVCLISPRRFCSYIASPSPDIFEDKLHFPPIYG